MNDANSIATEQTADAVLSVFEGDATYELTGHDYDGIQEYDNPLPGWWKWLFVGTVLFAFPYWAYYHFGATGRTLADAHDAAAAENSRLQFAEIGELDGDSQTLAKYMADASWVKVGQSVFKSNCVSCHGPTGGGVVGPNLTDQAFKNIKTIEDIYKIVNNGAAAGAMPAWQNRLEQNERVLVAAYVASLRGTDPGPSAKAEEGRAIPPWPIYVEPPTPEPQSNESQPSEQSTPETSNAQQPAV